MLVGYLFVTFLIMQRRSRIFNERAHVTCASLFKVKSILSTTKIDSQKNTHIFKIRFTGFSVRFDFS